ncbi:hypothetical protein BCR42DRAFT_337724 [Absidia repens]|uniref:TLC domain-containing protein n=1 Tax=Absidia repens TaxID=90262 RepID=A0A1X2HYT4_9FUNG|nr:hypothetical protein BCR42DRAFT_337724 [Absidia repens]
MSFLCSFLTLGMYFSICVGDGRAARTEKQISWLLTLASSVMCTLISLPHIYQFFRSGWDMQQISADSPLHTALTCFFITYLILDLGLGLIYYASRVTLATGWIHHTLYTAVLFWLMRCRSSSFFTTNAILELPTVILAVGAIYPRWRCDWLFATAFFFLRIIYHMALIYMLKYHHRLTHLWIVALIILPLHLYWFCGIVRCLLQKGKKPHP